MKVFNRDKLIQIEIDRSEIKAGDFVISNYVLERLNDEGTFINHRGEKELYDVEKPCGEDHIVGVNSEGKLSALGYTGNNLINGCSKVTSKENIKVSVPYYYKLK